jgi:hypothetical protein
MEGGRVSTIEERRCDFCGCKTASDELYSLPAEKGWGRLSVREDEGTIYYDLCPKCVTPVIDFLANRRSILGVSPSPHCTPSAPPRSSPPHLL